MATSKTTTPKKAPAAKPAKAAATAKAPAAKPTTAKTPAANPAPKVRKAPEKKPRPAVTSEQRRNYVEVAAYFIAERHGFTPGRELDDWAEAEAEIERLLAAGLLNT